MKKAKIMLTAIAVLAVVGGTLAFKASTFGKVQFYTLDGTQCIFKGGVIDVGNGNVSVTDIYTTTGIPEFNTTTDAALCADTETGLLEN